MKNRIYIGVIFGSIVISALVFLPACKRYHRNQSHAAISESSIRQGESLAQLYCQSCHALPDPALLDAKSWERGVLPQMGPRLGIFNYNFQQYPSNRGDTNLKGYYPASPVLRLDEWQHILDYYTATSPDSLPGQSRSRPIKKELPLFKAEIPAFRYDMPATSLVRIDSLGGNPALLLFDIHQEMLYRLNTALQRIDSLAVKGAIVDVNQRGKDMVVCNIGVLNPNNGKFGKVQSVFMGESEKVMEGVDLFSGLSRPVQLAAADLNQDGNMDYLVCEFGNLVGALSWLESNGKGQYERHVIKPVPGAIRAYIDDYNHDGKPDIWALFAQGDEGIFRFTNEGKGKFREERILQFPAMYGSSYFELDDFDKDGHPDILYTCGDNADFSPVLKPYHGIYIYMNDGHDHFTQRYFFPIHGCYKAMARDFDGDGDLDIAAISFFADYVHQPEEGFVYLENLGGWDFQPYSLPEGQLGKWLTMDAGDLDGDGRTDIVLGNFSFFSPVTAAGVDFKKGPPFILLRNQGAH